MNVAGNPALDVHVVIRRIFALIIDFLVLSVIMLFVNINFGARHITGYMLHGYNSTYSVDWPWYVLVAFCYFFIQEVCFSTTIGKRFMGLIVVDNAGQPITLRAALLRNLLRFIDAFPGFYLLGGIVMLLKPQRQRIGDLVAETLVVRRTSVPVSTLDSVPQPSAFRASMVCLLFVVACITFGYFTRPAQVISEMRVTHDMLFDDESMTNFKLGAPSWGIGTVAYPVQYQDQVDGRSFACQGEIVMNFIPARGWASTTGTGSTCQVIK